MRKRMCVCVYMRVCVYTRKRERERERVCVYVCVLKLICGLCRSWYKNNHVILKNFCFFAVTYFQVIGHLNHYMHSDNIHSGISLAGRHCCAADIHFSVQS